MTQLYISYTLDNMYTCSIKGCSKKRIARGWCPLHYRRWLHNGDPTKTLIRLAGEGTIRHGYKVLTINGQRVSEHRYVMEKLLNRKLERTELVHHLDHNKLNNSPGNLQIMNRIEHVKLHSTKTFRNSTHKQCTRCLKIKPRFLFAPDCRPNMDANQSKCKECDAIDHYNKRH